MIGYSVPEYDQIFATHPLEILPMEFTTKVCWITPAVEDAITPAEIAGALYGAEHPLIAAMPGSCPL